MSENLVLPLAPRSVDRVRLIRRSQRCLVFGLIGLVPLLGTPLASQALSLGRSVSRELGEQWAPPPVYFYWAAGLLACWAVQSWFKAALGVVVCGGLLGAQSWHLWRRFLKRRQGEWNPGWPQVILGMMAANAGIACSLWLLGLILSWIVRASSAT